MGIYADRLVSRLDRASEWPLWDDRQLLANIGDWIALRDNDRDRLREMSGYGGDKYVIDPMPERISAAFAAAIFGQPLDITAANEGDADLLAELVAENALQSALQRAALTSSSEGEVWWRAFVDPDLLPVPVLEWFSRTAVVPLWIGSRLGACAFVARLDPPRPLAEGQTESQVYRHFEVHDRVDVLNVLYLGTDTTIGHRVDLAARDETRDLMDAWHHGFDEMLAGRVVNREGADPRAGKSDYDGIRDLLLELNETASTGAKNRKLTARKRVVVPQSSLDAEGNLPEDQEVLVADKASQRLDNKDTRPPFAVLEYSFDATALNEWWDGVAVKALTRVGITPQFVGLSAGDSDGSLTSGTALRIRLIPTTNAASERGQYYDTEQPRQLEMLQRLDALEPDFGFGRPWIAPADRPSVSRGPAINEDLAEKANRHATLLTAKAESTKTAVEDLHPEWDDDQVQAEIDAIREDGQTSPAGSLANLLGAGGNGASDNGDGTSDAGPPADQQDEASQAAAGAAPPSGAG